MNVRRFMIMGILLCSGVCYPKVYVFQFMTKALMVMAESGAVKMLRLITTCWPTTIAAILVFAEADIQISLLLNWLI